jgi:hypothetical protein
MPATVFLAPKLKAYKAPWLSLTTLYALATLVAVLLFPWLFAYASGSNNAYFPNDTRLCRNKLFYQELTQQVAVQKTHS